MPTGLGRPQPRIERTSGGSRSWVWATAAMLGVAAVGVAAWWFVMNPVGGPDLESGTGATVVDNPVPSDVAADAASLSGQPDVLADEALADEASGPSVLGSGSAIVVVATEPPGAQVLIGGEAAGQTPLQLRDVRAGLHDVVLDHPDFERVELGGETFVDDVVLRIERTLVPATGQLTVITEPETAWVERNGTRLAQGTPVTLEGLPAGTVELTLGAVAYRDVSVVAEVPRDGVGRLVWTLEPIPNGTLTVEVEPPDAIVTLPEIGPAYEPGMALLEGEYRVAVSREGYRAVTRTVAVSGETRERVVLELSPQPFTVQVMPSEARVDVHGAGNAEGSAGGIRRACRDVHAWHHAVARRLPGTGQRRGLRVGGGDGDARSGTDGVVDGVAAQAAAVHGSDGSTGRDDWICGHGRGLRTGHAVGSRATTAMRVSAEGFQPWEGVVRHGNEPTSEEVRLSIVLPPVGGTFSDALIAGGEGPEMVVIPAGRFRMGCVSGEDCEDDEFPVHEVTIPEAFAVSVYEVTYAQWDACVLGGGCGGYRPDDEGWGRGTRPVINVLWNDAQEIRGVVVKADGRGLPFVERVGMGVRGAGGHFDGVQLGQRPWVEPGELRWLREPMGR